MPWTEVNGNPALNGIQRTESFRDKYVNLLRTAQDVHMYVNGSYDTSKENFEESVEVLKVKMKDWIDPQLAGTTEVALSDQFGDAVKLVIKAALCEAELFLSKSSEQQQARRKICEPS